MPVPLQEFVRQVLLENDRGAKFHCAIHQAWEAIKADYRQRNRWRRKATLRAVMWEETIKRLAEVVADDPDLTLIEHDDTVSIIAEGAVLFRLKHANPALVTSNYPTPLATAFDDHSIDLYGFSGLQRVELCYVSDQFNETLIWVGIAARQDGSHLWKIELDGAGTVAPPIELPLEEKATDPAKLARLKPQPDQDKRGKKNDKEK